MAYTTRSTERIFSLLLLLVSLFVIIPAVSASAAEGQAKTVAVLPFEMHAPSSMAYLQDGLRDMLASRLAANGGAVIVEQARVNSLLPEAGKTLPQKEAAAIARQLAADYVITGSLTSLGGSMSIDAKAISSDDAVAPQNFYASAKAENEIIGAINQLAWDIGAGILGVTPPAAAASARSAAPAPTPEDDAMAAFKTEHPEKIYKQQGSVTGSPIIMAQAASIAQGFTKTQNLDYFLSGMDVGDIDGDGQLDVVMANERKIYAYRLVNNRLAEIGTVEMPARSKIHAVSLGDIDNNGRAEIYISAADDYKPYSWAYEWDGTRLDMVLDNIPWYIRVIDIPGEGRVLVGQRGGNDSLLLEGIFRLMKSGTTVLPQERIPMPGYVNLFDFALADVNGDGSNEIVGINKADRIYVVRPDGSVLWVSEDFYGGTSRYIGEAADLINPQGVNINTTPSYDVIGREGSGRRIYIPSRIIVMDINHDGKDDVVVNKNLSFASRHIEDYKSFKTSEIYALAWNGIAMGEVWQTRKIDGYIPDFQFLRQTGNQKKAKLFVGLVLSTGWTSSFTGGESTMLMYDVDLAGEKEDKSGAAN